MISLVFIISPNKNLTSIFKIVEKNLLLITRYFSNDISYKVIILMNGNFCKSLSYSAFLKFILSLNTKNIKLIFQKNSQSYQHCMSYLINVIIDTLYVQFITCNFLLNRSYFLMIKAIWQKFNEDFNVDVILNKINYHLFKTQNNKNFLSFNYANFKYPAKIYSPQKIKFPIISAFPTISANIYRVSFLQDHKLSTKGNCQDINLFTFNAISVANSVFAAQEIIGTCNLYLKLMPKLIEELLFEFSEISKSKLVKTKINHRKQKFILSKLMKEELEFLFFCIFSFLIWPSQKLLSSQKATSLEAQIKKQYMLKICKKAKNNMYIFIIDKHDKMRIDDFIKECLNIQ